MAAGPVTEPITRSHNCQTPECPNDFAVIIIRVDEGESDLLCDSCHLAFNLAVLQKLAEEGLIELAPAAADGRTETPAIAGVLRQSVAR